MAQRKRRRSLLTKQQLAALQPHFESYFSTVGGRLRALRKVNGLTQTKLAEEVGLASGSTICRIEGGIGLPSVRTLIRFAEHMGFSADYLLGLSEEAELHRRRRRTG